jgi:ribonuclease HII
VEKRINLPTLEVEEKIWKEGFKFICGIDEAGRGALAGPLVVGAVILPRKKIRGINDSKKLNRKQRNQIFEKITKEAVCWGVGIAETDEINLYGIQTATYLACHRAINSLKNKPDFLIIDHYRLPATTLPQISLTYGDRRSLSVAAASIIAKVTRDRIMEKIAKRREFKKYGFDKNFGYGTKFHQIKIQKTGISRIHRIKFVSNTIEKQITLNLFGN